MAGRNPAEAVEAFVAPIRLALGFFAQGRLSYSSRHPSEGEGVLAFNDGDPFPLDARGRATMTLSMRYVIVEDVARGPWKVSTTGWMYSLDVKDNPMVEYHWHPISDSHATMPHVHVDGARSHLPTGRVLIEDVLAYGVDCGVVCKQPDKWAEVLADNRAKFWLGATWGANRPPQPSDNDAGT